MLLLFQLGQLLEPAIGRIRFALLYFAALLAGSAGALLLQPNAIHGGASGAVFGLMGAAFVGMRNQGVNPFSTGLGATLVVNLLITFSIPGISIGGHIGGIIGGAVAGWIVLAPLHKRVPVWATYAAPTAVIVLSLLVSVVVVKT
jgi:membrane associated rhomboid family serine protease